jgi:hypothetical protein
MHKWRVFFLLPIGSLWAQTSRDVGRQVDLDFFGTQSPKLHINFHSPASQASPAHTPKKVLDI